MNAQPSSIDCRAASLAGLAYTLVVFVFAFAIGAVRVTLVAPHFGPVLAVLLESPIVLAVSWRVSSACVRHFKLNNDSHACFLMGAVAFVTLMLLELGFSTWVFGESVDQYVARFQSIEGVIGLLVQVCFATLPWLQKISTFGK